MEASRTYDSGTTNYTNLMVFFYIMVPNEKTTTGVEFWLLLDLLKQFEMVKADL